MFKNILYERRIILNHIYIEYNIFMWHVYQCQTHRPSALYRIFIKNLFGKFQPLTHAVYRVDILHKYAHKNYAKSEK